MPSIPITTSSFPGAPVNFPFEAKHLVLYQASGLVTVAISNKNHESYLMRQGDYLQLEKPTFGFQISSTVSNDNLIFSVSPSDTILPLSIIDQPTTTALPPGMVTIGNISTLIVPTNPGRHGLYIGNSSTSGQLISLAFGTAAQNSYGITLDPSGWFIMDKFSFTNVDVYAIATAPSAIVSIQEFQ
jgi:hypothetical protein